MAAYTDEQMSRYLAHIGYESSLEDARRLASSNPLDLLTRIQILQMAKVPFESVSLHYSLHRTLSLDLDDLFDKIVGHGRGGYCMEVNAFFAAVLRGLGYKSLVSVGGKVKHGSEYNGWAHMLNLVRIDNKRYAVDVGFGSNGPTYPIPLEDGYEFVTIAPSRGKLEYRHIDQLTDPDQKVWVYSVKADEDAAWREAYMFVELEFMPCDFEIMNFHTSTSPRSFFVQTVMCMRTILDDKRERPIGKMILHRDYVKQVIGDKSEIIQQFECEQQRVDALAKYFDLVLRKKDQRAIAGMATELIRRSTHA